METRPRAPEAGISRDSKSSAKGPYWRPECTSAGLGQRGSRRGCGATCWRAYNPRAGSRGLMTSTEPSWLDWRKRHAKRRLPWPFDVLDLPRTAAGRRRAFHSDRRRGSRSDSWTILRRPTRRSMCPLKVSSTDNPYRARSNRENACEHAMGADLSHPGTAAAREAADEAGTSGGPASKVATTLIASVVARSLAYVLPPSAVMACKPRCGGS